MNKGMILLFLLCGIPGCGSQEKSGGTPSRVEAGNSSMGIEVNPLGGAITALWLKSDSLNLLNWALTREEMPENNREGAPFEGHFLCYGRWGAPTEGEIAQGIPHNGEHNNLVWAYELSDQGHQLRMSVHAEKDRVSIERTIQFAQQHPFFTVEEQFTHRSATGRLSNVVQHVTLGPPYLSPETRFYSNCLEGFLQEDAMPDPHKNDYTWPWVIQGGDTITELTRFDTTRNYVSTHIFDGPAGWVMAFDPVSRVFIGYTWDTAEYPWINIWNQNREGRVFAKGLEFGTTGIGMPYDELMKDHPPFHGRNSYFFFDAGETRVFGYTGFAGKTGYAVEGVERVEKTEEGLRIVFISSGGKREKLEYSN